MKILAIDLGGQSTKVALLDGEIIVKKWKIDTDLNNIFKNIKDNLTDLNDKDYDVIGLSMPGFIDHEKAIVTLAGNLNLKNFDIKKEFKKYFSKPVYVLNDANAATLGEFWVGAGKKHKSIILYTIGTGIGGGIVLNGQLIYGKNGYAGELGHGGHFQDVRPCTCGLKHCLEATSSASGIEKDLKAHFKKDIKLIDVAEDFKNGDKEIIEIFKNALRPLAQHMATMETALNPDAIIIGGGPSAIGEPLRKLIEDLIFENQLDFVAQATEILIAQKGNDAGVYGAAYFAKQQQENKILV